MILRSAKIVVKPERQGEIVRQYEAYTEGFALRQPGIVAVRLLRDLRMDNKFFLHSWWEGEAAMAAAVSTADFGDIRAAAQEDFLERVSVYLLDVVDEDPRPLVPAVSALVTTRLAKLTVRPGADAVMEEEYHRLTEGYTRRQPGCLRVQLFRDRHVRSVYFIQSYWRDAAALAAARDTEEFYAIRADTLRYLEERMTAWEMRIVVDDVHAPIFLPEARE